MYKSFGLQVRLAGKTHAEYVDHWVNVHAPMSAGIAPLLGYVLNEVLEYITVAGISELEILTEIDGIAQIWFAGKGGLAELAEIPAVQRWFQDGPNFVGNRMGFITEEELILPVTGNPRPSVKAFFFMRRKPGMAVNEFCRQIHRNLGLAAKGMPGLKGLCVSDVISGNASVNVPDYALPEVDAIGELWFESEAAAKAAFASSAEDGWFAQAAAICGSARAILTREMVIRPVKTT
jgi:Methylmuconolactone methyl-isomerase/EthD domain